MKNAPNCDPFLAVLIIVKEYFIIFYLYLHNSFIAFKVLYSHDAEQLRRRLKRANLINYHKQPFLS